MENSAGAVEFFVEFWRRGCMGFEGVRGGCEDFVGVMARASWGSGWPLWNPGWCLRGPGWSETLLLEEISVNMQFSSKFSRLDYFLSRKFPYLCSFPRSAFYQSDDAFLISRTFQLYGKYPRKSSAAADSCSRKTAP